MRRIVSGLVIAVAVAIVLAACGGRGTTVPGTGTPVAVGPSADAAGAPKSLVDPLSEASLRADVAWLTAPERNGRGAATAPAVVRWLVDQLGRDGYQAVTQPIASAPDQSNVIAVWHPGGEPDAPTTIL